MNFFEWQNALVRSKINQKLIQSGKFNEAEVRIYYGLLEGPEKHFCVVFILQMTMRDFQIFDSRKVLKVNTFQKKIFSLKVFSYGLTSSVFE